MKKILQRTRRFEKSLRKLPQQTKQLFLEKLTLFVEDELHPQLKTHALKGSMKGIFAFSITRSIRVIYEKRLEKGQAIIIFTLMDIGTHDQVYE